MKDYPVVTNDPPEVIQKRIEELEAASKKLNTWPEVD